MSLGPCIPGLEASGQLTPEQAARAQALFDEQLAALGKSMAPAAAAAAASKRTVDAFDYEAALKRANMLRQVAARDFAENWLTRGGERWGRGAKGEDPSAGSGQAGDGSGGDGGGVIPGEGPVGPANPRAARTLVALVEARRIAIRGEAFAKVGDLLYRMRATLTGQLRRPAEMDEIGRAAFGEGLDAGGAGGVGLAARELVGGVIEVGEWLRLRANAAGASIGKLANRGFSTQHDSRKVAEAGYDAWWAAERPRWDLDRMVDEATGQPFTEAGLDAASRAAFETIASDGVSKLTPGGMGKASFASQLGQHRFIHYKNYDAWKASQEQFGTGTAFDALVGEIEGMSRAAAAMEILGPNPPATMRYVTDRIGGDPALFKPGQLKARDAAASETKKVEALWDEYTGALRVPESRRLAVAFSSYRAIAAAGRLGSAAPKALSDIGFGTATRLFNGLPITGIGGQYLKMLNPLDARDRLLAARLGFVFDTWTSRVSGTQRQLGEELTGEMPRAIADGVLRASGLNWVTDAGRGAHGLVTFGHLTDTRGQQWDALEPAWRAALQRYRIGPAQWDVLRAARVSDDIGMIEPAGIADREVRDRFLEMAHSEKEFAVPVPDLETRAWLDKNARKGAATGEMLRSSPFMFKTFSAAVMLRHGSRMIGQSGISGKAGYLLSAVVPVTVISLLATQLLEIAKGRDPRPMDDPKLWGQALANGGGLSILGDIAGITAEDRYMGGVKFLAGPLATDTFDLLGAGKDLAQGDEKAPWKMARIGKQYVPGQNFWYSRAATDRLLADQLQTLIDPNYRQSWRAMERRAADQGQEFYWAPGELSPDRAPDLSNAYAGDEQ